MERKTICGSVGVHTEGNTSMGRVIVSGFSPYTPFPLLFLPTLPATTHSFPSHSCLFLPLCPPSLPHQSFVHIQSFLSLYSFATCLSPPLELYLLNLHLSSTQFHPYPSVHTAVRLPLLHRYTMSFSPSQTASYSTPSVSYIFPGGLPLDLLPHP